MESAKFAMLRLNSSLPKLAPRNGERLSDEHEHAPHFQSSSPAHEVVK
jgi:hypothetical protein